MPILLFGVVIIILVVSLLGEVEKESRVDTWAQEHGYRVVDKDRCYFDLGPFWYRGKHQTVFKMVLEKNGERKTAYARVGWGIEVEFVK